MKKKRFYNNKKRNSKWTEKETGRKISFADKYIDAGSGSDKFDFKRPKPKKKRTAKEKTAKLFKNIAIVIACFLIISVGYSAMDLYIDRNAMPETEENTGESVSFSNVNLMLKGMSVQSISLDNSVMLDSVIKSAEDEAYSSVTFDLKRDDGTIGYNSKLATIRAYGAISSPAAQLEKSVAKLNQADIIPIGRISCYKDNIVALSDLDSAIKNGKSVYKDANGNAYLDPNNSTTYNYIKSIIEETKAMGINVFLLDNTKLPGDISGDYNDGFAALAKKLYAEFGQDIKFIEAIDVTINDDSISDEPVTDENGDTVYNTTSSFDSEEFTSGYGDSNETIGDDGTVSTSKKREPMTDEDGDIIYGNDGQPVYPTKEGETTATTKARIPLTDEDGDIIYGNDGQPVYPTKEGETTATTKARIPLTDEDGDIVYGNDGSPVYSTEESSASEVTTQGSSSLEKQIDKKISKKSSGNKMYYISTNNAQKVKKILDNKKITNYIIQSTN